MTTFSVTDTTLNIHESERSKPSSWIPFAWMPVYKDTLAPERSVKGLTGHAARRVQLEHEALAHVFDDWTERTADAVDLCWAGSLRRKSKLYLAAVVVDQPQLDKFAASGGIPYEIV